MNTVRRTDPEQATLAGKVSALAGIVALAAFVWIWALSATSFDPPQWARILGSMFLPVGLAGAIGAGATGVRSGGRVWAYIGLALAAVTVVVFVVLLNAYG
ncbi:hypothetical protein EV651_102440 [Kribbella sp. VKM Ac-2571]|uniref:hypothetical protein n=1 Tax=Kribbella sp. VKM Ac-2571 TaxID=2512222 RepID=UPI00105D8928|nr:hypothetical protein [Kribbella sp. VKM Ac-2571]TDO68518.1 hypothetical protein EV651_102440 [Kribbella sp. VKM Ac-2571]